MNLGKKDVEGRRVGVKRSEAGGEEGGYEQGEVKKWEGGGVGSA